MLDQVAALTDRFDHRGTADVVFIRARCLQCGAAQYSEPPRRREGQLDIGRSTTVRGLTDGEGWRGSDLREAAQWS